MFGRVIDAGFEVSVGSFSTRKDLTFQRHDHHSSTKSLFSGPKARSQIGNRLALSEWTLILINRQIGKKAGSPATHKPHTKSLWQRKQ